MRKYATRRRMGCRHCDALQLLERPPEPTPELLWRNIAPFLCDATGNSHRAEINVEKLWNPLLPGRGTPGVPHWAHFATA